MARARELFDGDGVASPSESSTVPRSTRAARRARSTRVSSPSITWWLTVLWSDLEALRLGRGIGWCHKVLALDFEFTDYCFWQTTLEQRPMGRSHTRVSGDCDRELRGFSSAGRSLWLAARRPEARAVFPYVWRGSVRLRGCALGCADHGAPLRVLPYSYAISTAFFLSLARRVIARTRW